MKICIVSPNFPPMSWPCGAAHFVKSYAGQLADQGHDVTVLTSNENADQSSEKFSVEVRPGNWDLPHLKDLALELRREKFDVVDLQYEVAMYKGTAKCLMLPVLLKGTGSRNVLTLHSQGLPSRFGRAWRPMQVLPWDKVVFYSQPFFERLRKWFPQREKDFYILGFPTNIVRANALGLDKLVGRMKAEWIEDDFIMTYFGHINYGRGIEDVFQAVQRMKNQGRRIHLIMMSQFKPEENDYHRELIELSKSMEIFDQITFTGRVEDDVVSKVMQASDLCILPFPEGASFKNGSLAAAVDHGVPTITTVSDLTETDLVENGALQTYTSGDVDGLTERLEKLTSDANYLKSIQQKTIEMRDIFSWSRYVGKRLEIYTA